MNEHTNTVNIRMKHLKTCLMLLLITKRKKRTFKRKKITGCGLFFCLVLHLVESFHKRFIWLVCGFWYNLMNYFYQTKSSVTLNWLKLFPRMRTLFRGKQK